jgi:hypothetical protein
MAHPGRQASSYPEGLNQEFEIVFLGAEARNEGNLTWIILDDQRSSE